ncbi:hypothetical protein QQZ08_007219 [Neonectria magnoliae]|uniref:Uncharacterized protein n=1 Tax=Neonectria magnoliae TaxID=2732573 RepID=A0ABR1I066_9HYPO
MSQETAPNRPDGRKPGQLSLNNSKMVGAIIKIKMPFEVHSYIDVLASEDSDSPFDRKAWGYENAVKTALQVYERHSLSGALTGFIDGNNPLCRDLLAILYLIDIHYHPRDGKGLSVAEFMKQVRTAAEDAATVYFKKENYEELLPSHIQVLAARYMAPFARSMEYIYGFLSKVNRLHLAQVDPLV